MEHPNQESLAYRVALRLFELGVYGVRSPSLRGATVADT